MSDKVTIFWTDGHDKSVSREVNQVLDIRNFVGTPGYAMLVVAANTALSVSDIERFLRYNGVGRSRSWIQRRRWMFQQPDAVNADGAKRNADSKDEQAFAIMRDHPTASLRDLVQVLKDSGINRGREWVRMNRCRSAE